jgi:predicted nucleic acid-binding protein
VILLDTSGLLAALDRSQRFHDAAVAALRAALLPWMPSPFVLAELDYLRATRVGQVAERELLAEVGAGCTGWNSSRPMTSLPPSASSGAMGRWAPAWRCLPFRHMPANR